MLKFLLILFLIGYVLFKFSGFIVKFLFANAYKQQQQFQRNQRSNTTGHSKRPADGNVNIDYVPKGSEKPGSKPGFKGGEYVDYEEVD